MIELRIRMKLIELRKIHEKSEQQLNIINSGQVDLWLQDHNKEMDEIREELEILRATVSQQASDLHAYEKKKIDRVIINQVDVLERESNRIRKAIRDNHSIAAKLHELNSKQQEELERQKQSYLDLTQGIDIDIDELLDLDIDKNESKYWRLVDVKESLERHLYTLDRTIKR